MQYPSSSLSHLTTIALLIIGSLAYMVGDNNTVQGSSNHLPARDRQPTNYWPYKTGGIGIVVCVQGDILVNTCIAAMVDYQPFPDKGDEETKFLILDHNCILIGQHNTTREKLALSNGISFNSELQDYLVVQVDRAWGITLDFSKGVSLGYNSKTVNPFLTSGAQYAGVSRLTDGQGWSYTFNARFDCTPPS